MAYRILTEQERKWQPRKGLEGPFFYPNGRVAYYDPIEGAYWDPTTDFYISRDEMDFLNNDLMRKLERA